MPDIENHWASINGHFNFDKFYDKMVERFPSGSRFAEIGVYYGRSVCYLASRIIKAKKDIKVYCVDIYKELDGSRDIYEDFLRNASVYGDVLIPVKMESLDFCHTINHGSLDMVFIDSNHEYLNCKADMISWSYKLKSNGILAGHDYMPAGVPDCWPGVGIAVRELFGKDFTTIDNTWIRTTNLPNTQFLS